MSHPIPNAALDDRLAIENAILMLGAQGTLQISSVERLPFWVILKHWHHIVRDGDCHVFVGNNGNRYGHRRIEYGHRPFYVHRIAYALRWGPIPDGLVVRHTCGRNAILGVLNPQWLAWLMGYPTNWWSPPYEDLATRSSRKSRPSSSERPTKDKVQ